MELQIASHIPDARRQFWLEKWVGAGGQNYDGRLIALKNDPVWRAMTGARRLTGECLRRLTFRGYDVKRAEAQALGLIQLMEELDPAAFVDEAPASLVRKIVR